MSVQLWIKKWEDRSLGFHQEEVEPLLVKFSPFLPKVPVLVPLCGKSKDMIWLRDQGHSVIGIEASPIACREFFSENNISNVKMSKQGDFQVYSADRIQIYCGDFFQLALHDLPHFSGVYDRAALIALDSQSRRTYAKKITELVLAQNAPTPVPYLLIALEYNPGKIKGPPYSVTSGEIRDLYGKGFDISPLLKERDV
ncbi:unnamed protein product, partial [Sphagnum tenellum]